MKRVTMRLSASRCLLIFALATAGISAGGTEQEPVEVEPRSVDFSGSWELDYKLTENPRDKLRWLYEVARSQLQQQNAAMRNQAS